MSPDRQFDLDRLIVVLVDTRNPLNLGAAARAMSNFGFQHLRVVRPYEPSFREARSAVGASELLARAEEFPTVADAVSDCVFVAGTTAARDREPQVPLHGMPSAASILRDHAQKGRVAILFGSEKRGLSNADLNHCHCLVRIPTREQHSSMNLGHAVAVCLYELIREKPTSARTNGENATAPQGEFAQIAVKHDDLQQVTVAQGELERITETLFDALRASGYVSCGAEQVTEAKVRRLIRRLKLRQPDAELLLGMFRQIVWKLHSSEKEPHSKK